MSSISSNYSDDTCSSDISSSSSIFSMSSTSSLSLSVSVTSRRDSLSSLTEAIAASPPSLKVCRSPNGFQSYLASLIFQEPSSNSDEDEGPLDEPSYNGDDNDSKWIYSELMPQITKFSSSISISTSVVVSEAIGSDSPIVCVEKNDVIIVCNDKEEEEDFDLIEAERKKANIEKANRRWAETEVIASDEEEEEEAGEMIFSLELSSDQLQQEENEEEELPKKLPKKSTAVVRFDLEHIEEFIVPAEDDCRTQDWCLAAFDRWRTGEIISSILAAEHRERIYQQRFAKDYHGCEGEDDN